MFRRSLTLSVPTALFGSWGSAQAQRAAVRPLRVGWVSLFSLAQNRAFIAAFRDGLTGRGFVEGRNLEIDTALADEDAERLPALVDGLLRRAPDVIVTQGPAIFAFRTVQPVPVVFGFSGDPVLAGLVESLARPNRNMTGMTFMSLDLNEKRLDLVREVLPEARRIVLMGNPIHPGADLEVETIRVAARRLGLAVDWVPTANAREMAAALAAFESSPPDALVVLPDALMTQSMGSIVAFGRRNRVPTVSGWAVFARNGGLLTYGPNLNDCFRGLADTVMRIHQGARAADLPVQRPTNFELVVNLRTAEALGLTLPTSLLGRADRVIG